MSFYPSLTKGLVLNHIPPNIMYIQISVVSYHLKSDLIFHVILSKSFYSVMKIPNNFFEEQNKNTCGITCLLAGNKVCDL